MWRKWWNSDLMVLVRRLAIVYLVLVVCRVVFYLYNSDLIGPLATGECWKLAGGAFRFDSVSVFYAFTLFVVLSLLPFRFRERRWFQRVLFWYFAIVTSLVAALNLADTIYFHYTQIRFTAADFFFAENDNTGHLIGTFAAENWYLVLAWAAITAGALWLYRHSGRPVTPIRNHWLYFGVNLCLLAGAGLVSLAAMRGGGLSRELRPITLSNAAAYTTSSAKANLILSNPFCILRTMGNRGISYTKYFPQETLDSLYTPYHFPPPLDSVSTAGPLAGYNVVLFVMESFSAEHSALLNPDLYPDGGGYTPFLDSLMRNGYCFTRGYANGHKSIEALPSLFASIPSFKRPFVLMPEALGEGRQLPRILNEERDYETLFFCGSPHGSMGFDAYALSAGIERIYDKDDYDANYPGNDDYDGFWGVWDEPFVRFMGSILDQTPQPFFASIFTISSHHPFVVPAQYADSLPAGRTKIHKGVAYTDMAVRRFFERYGDSEWFHRTLFVFSADHVSSERFAPKTDTPVGTQHIILFFYTPDGSLRGRDERVFQQTDVMPTVLGLLGYDKPYFAFGRDAFREPERLPVAMSYSTHFLGVADSLAMLFDEREPVAVYAASDTLQQRNIVAPADSAQQVLQRYMEAFIQQYYSHLERKQFTVPKQDSVGLSR